MGSTVQADFTNLHKRIVPFILMLSQIVHGNSLSVPSESVVHHVKIYS